eukprot:5646669-Pyramimonas_sp.AAC.1
MTISFPPSGAARAAEQQVRDHAGHHGGCARNEQGVPLSGDGGARHSALLERRRENIPVHPPSDWSWSVVRIYLRILRLIGPS